jgi:GTP-binding protein
MPSYFRSKIHSGPVNRRSVSVAAIGTSHSGKALIALSHICGAPAAALCTWAPSSPKQKRVKLPSVKILSAELVTSASIMGPREGLLRDDVPQFVFWGRSNVGKSSLLNALTRQKLARTSAAPGRTRQANIFRITAEGGTGALKPWTAYFVDLPGYGYARGGHESVRELQTVVEAYFSAAERQRTSSEHRTPGAEERGAIFLLIDSRHPGLESDVQTWKLISQTAAPHIVATKIDKLSRAERARNLRELERTFGRAPLPVSVTSGEGLDQLWRVIASRVGAAGRG